jgi:hypothetical protein
MDDIERTIFQSEIPLIGMFERIENDPEHRALDNQMNSFENKLHQMYNTLKQLIPETDMLTPSEIIEILNRESGSIVNKNITEDTIIRYKHLNGLLCIFLFTIDEEEKFNLIKSSLPKNIFSEKEWQKLLVLAKKVYTVNKNEPVTYQKNWVDTLLPLLRSAVIQLGTILQDGDTVIGLGNTPQYILEALKYSKKRLKLIPVSLSGHPGSHKKISSYLNGILTEQGLLNFMNYLNQLHLGPSGNHTNIYILDFVGKGLGIEFFIHRLRRLYEQEEVPMPKISVIAINTMQAGASYDSQNNYLIGTSLKIPLVSLNESELARRLDNMDTEYRVTPDFPAWRWHNWNTDPTKQPVGIYAPLAIESIKKYFSGYNKKEIVNITPDSNYFKPVT